MTEAFIWDHNSLHARRTDGEETQRILAEIHNQIVREESRYTYSHKVNLPSCSSEILAMTWMPMHCSLPSSSKLKFPWRVYNLYRAYNLPYWDISNYTGFFFYISLHEHFPKNNCHFFSIHVNQIVSQCIYSIYVIHLCTFFSIVERRWFYHHW